MAKKKPSDFGLKWTDLSTYPTLIAEANSRYNFGLTDEDISSIRESLVCLSQPDSLKPISLAVWPKGKLDQNIGKLFQWFVDRERECEGIEIKLKCLNGSKIAINNCVLDYYDDKAELETIVINLKNSRVECTYENFSIIVTRLGIELLPFLALNPQCLKAMNGKGIGNIIAPGLLFCDSLTPMVSYKNGQLIVSFLLEN